MNTNILPIKASQDDADTTIRIRQSLKRALDVIAAREKVPLKRIIDDLLASFAEADKEGQKLLYIPRDLQRRLNAVAQREGFHLAKFVEELLTDYVRADEQTHGKSEKDEEQRKVG